MSGEITGKAHSLGSVFDAQFSFHIPSYQRPYSWTTEEAGQLYDDLFSAYKENNNDNYFLGSIVLIKEEETKPESDVIDGQQRLVTLTILIAAIASKLTGTRRDDCCKLLLEEGNAFKGVKALPRVTLRAKDQRFFYDYVQSLNFDKLRELKSSSLPDVHARIQENAKLLLKRLNENFGDNEEELFKFGVFINMHCFLVVVCTSGRESAFRIFTVLNNRGLNLMTCDILKSDIIGKITEENPEDEETYTNKWEELEELVGQKLFNEVFSHIATIHIKAPTRLQLKEGLLEAITKEVLSKTTPKAFIDNQLYSYVRAFETLKNRNYVDKTYGFEINRTLDWLNKINNVDWIPSAILGMCLFRDKPDVLLRFLNKLDRMAYFMATTGMNNRKRLERYRPVLIELLNYLKGFKKVVNNVDEFVDSFKSLELNYHETTEFIEALNGNVYKIPPYRRTFILQKLDYIVSCEKSFIRYTNPLLVMSFATKYDPDGISYEQILPAASEIAPEWTEAWPDELEREEWVHRIANVVVVPKNTSSLLRKQSFEKKKDAYFKKPNVVSNYALANFVSRQEEWTPEVVAKRQGELLDIFSRYWELTLPKNLNLFINVKQFN